MTLTTDTDLITTDGGVVGAVQPSFGTLRQQVLDYLDRPDITDQFPFLVKLFQNKLNRVLRVSGMETEAVLTPDPVTGGALLPYNYQAWRSVRTTTSIIVPLEYVTPDALANRYPYAPPAGSWPGVFTIKGLTLFPLPVGPVTLTYYKGVQPYLDDTLNDWVLVNHFDAYLYGTLCEAELYLKNEDRAAAWNARSAAALQDIMSSDRDQRWGKAREMSMECSP